MYNWEGEELQVTPIVLSAGYDERLPSLFGDQLELRAIGPYNDEWGYTQTYTSNNLFVRVDQDYDYFDSISDIDYVTTYLDAFYYGFESQTATDFFVSNTDGYIAFQYPIYAVSDLGFIYEDEFEIRHLVLPPQSTNASDDWRSSVLSDWIAPDQVGLEFPFTVNNGIYGMVEFGGQYHLYALRFENQVPQGFDFVRSFDGMISDLKADHMIVEQEPEGLWVRHRLPACTQNGQCSSF